MATNIKNVDSEKYNKALSLKDRVSLEKIISTNRDRDGSLNITLNQIAAMLEKDPTTLSKEVKKRRTPISMDNPRFAYTALYCKSCSKSRDCKNKAAIKNCKGVCPQYERLVCKFLKGFPWVCNGCRKRNICILSKSYYNPIPSQDAYRYTLVDSRTGINMTQKEFDSIKDVLVQGLEKKQSIEHILASNDLPICTKTAYNYLHAGYLTDLTHAHRILRLRPDRGKKHNSLILRKEKIGKQYEDFQKLLEQNPGMHYVQMDTIIGKKESEPVVLSLHCVTLHFQFFFLLKDKSASSVVEKLNEIQDIIGLDNYKKVFGVILTDNGSEFTDIDGIMADPNTAEIRTQLFFCHTYASREKGACEKNHEYFRYILPKGSSFDFLSQDDLNLITSHINSTKRKSTDFSTPLELFRAFFGPDILDRLGISLIDPNSVVLSSELLKK